MQDEFMAAALGQAEEAFGEEEVPVGAVVVVGERVVAADHNRVEQLGDPTAHAEMLAITAAAAELGPRMTEAVLYSTLEPCFMCAGALIQARVAAVVYGARDEKFGACGSVGDILRDGRLNHTCSVIEGVGAEASADLLRRFFRARR